MTRPPGSVTRIWGGGGVRRVIGQTFHVSGSALRRRMAPSSLFRGTGQSRVQGHLGAAPALGTSARTPAETCGAVTGSVGAHHPAPGADPISTRKALADIGTEAGNLRNGPTTRAGGANEWLLLYLGWATDAVQRLRHVIADADIDRLVLNRRYYALLGCAGRLSSNTEAPLVNGLVSLELTEREAAFQAAVKTLDAHLDRWESRGRWFVVADSSFYLNSDAPLADADLHKALSLHTSEDIHLMFPIVVVDELDKLKESGKLHSRWRAGHTLGLLDQLLDTGTTGTLRRRSLPLPPMPGDPAVRSEVLGMITVEIVLDPPGHTRLPLADDEIIDRTVAIQRIAHRDVRLLTCDTGQATRGRLAGLKVTKLPHTAGTGDQPLRDGQGSNQQRGTGSRAQRKNRRDTEADAAEK